jgi:hypothetical protein
MVPQESPTPRDPAQRERTPMDTTESSAPHAHPSTDYHDDTVEAHYACLERPCACLDGWVFVGYIERVMNLGENRIEMRISRSAWFPRDLCFPHS